MLWEGEEDGEKALKIPSGTTVIKWVGKCTSGQISMRIPYQKEIKLKVRKDCD